MKTAWVIMLALAVTLGLVGGIAAQMSPQPAESRPGSMMGAETDMMGGGQMGQMMPMMQACTQMMQQMSALMGQHGAPQPPPVQPEKK